MGQTFSKNFSVFCGTRLLWRLLITIWIKKKQKKKHHTLKNAAVKAVYVIQQKKVRKKCVCVWIDLLSLDQSKTFYKPDWFDIVGAEVKCCKEAVCVIDMSSFTKFELTVSLLFTLNNQLWKNKNCPSCEFRLHWVSMFSISVTFFWART